MASRRVRPGEVILRERPAVLSPCGPVSQSVHCLECLALLDTDTCPTCPHCYYPLCEDCSQSEHHLQECGLLAVWAASHYHYLPHHRILQTKHLQPGLYHRLLGLPLSPSRAGGDHTRPLELHHRVGREEVEAVLALVESETVQLGGRGEEEAGLCGLYLVSALLSRQQQNNCRVLVSRDPPFLATVLATRDIMPGEEISRPVLHPVRPQEGVIREDKISDSTQSLLNISLEQTSNKILKDDFKGTSNSNNNTPEAEWKEIVIISHTIPSSSISKMGFASF